MTFDIGTLIDLSQFVHIISVLFSFILLLSTCCSFHIFESFTVAFMQLSVLLSIARILLKQENFLVELFTQQCVLKNLKLNETSSFVDLLNYVLSQTLRRNYCENCGTLEKVLVELTSFVICLITLVLLIQSSSGSMDLQIQYLVLHMHNCKGSLGCFSSSRLKNLSVDDWI